MTSWGHNVVRSVAPERRHNERLPKISLVENKLDYRAVRRYWDSAASDAAAASYMAHEQGLPQSCVRHRFAAERAIVEPWLESLTTESTLLDVGCGAGAWTTLFARRYRHVVGIDLSAKMLAAAQTRLKDQQNVELIEGDALDVPLNGPFDGAFLGGVLMYLNREDAVRLLTRLRLLIPNGPLIIRESTIREGTEVKNGEYHVVYRSPAEYTEIAQQAGLQVTDIKRNRGYADMEIAVELVNLLRRIPPIKRRQPALIGRPLWHALRLTAPLTLKLIPRSIEATKINWPHLTNHFMKLQTQ